MLWIQVIHERLLYTALMLKADISSVLNVIDAFCLLADKLIPVFVVYIQEAPCWCGIVPYLWGVGWPWIKFCWPQERKNSLPHFDFHPPQVKINQVFIGMKWENFFLCKVSQYDFFLTFNFSSNLQLIWSRPLARRLSNIIKIFQLDKLVFFGLLG